MLTTGMLISGKMSVGVRRSTTGVSKIIARPRTTNVYGLRNANRTIHISPALPPGQVARSAPDYNWQGAGFVPFVLSFLRAFLRVRTRTLLRHDSARNAAYRPSSPSA